MIVSHCSLSILFLNGWVPETTPFIRWFPHGCLSILIFICMLKITLPHSKKKKKKQLGSGWLEFADNELPKTCEENIQSLGLIPGTLAYCIESCSCFILICPSADKCQYHYCLHHSSLESGALQHNLHGSSLYTSITPVHVSTLVGHAPVDTVHTGFKAWTT